MRRLILGYNCVNDMTARDLQARNIQFMRTKGLDKFAPIGTEIKSEIDPGDLRISTYLNG